MQIEVRIAYKEPRNITLIVFVVKKYYGRKFCLFRPKNITIRCILTQEYQTYVTACAGECPSEFHMLQRWKNLHSSAEDAATVELYKCSCAGAYKLQHTAIEAQLQMLTTYGSLATKE